MADRDPKKDRRETRGRVNETRAGFAVERPDEVARQVEIARAIMKSDAEVLTALSK